MPHFGWTRLAYLLLVLTVLTVLARTGSPSAQTSYLTSEPTLTEAATDDTPSKATKPPQTTDMARRIEGASSLVDLEGDPPTRSVDTGSRLPASEAVPPGAWSGEPSPPVFYRPGEAGPPSVDAPAAGPVCGDLGRFPESSRVVFPLDDGYLYSYEDTWGAPRTQGGHEGTDLMAPAGTPEYAVTDGTVVPVAGSDENGWNTLGGYAVMVRADYSIGPVREGDLFYYAHLQRESPLGVGTRVRAGQVIGHAGDTGQGPEVTRGLFPSHLHFGWYDATGPRGVVASGAMNPYPLLEWIKANGGAITGGSDARYCESPGPPPDTRAWPAPDAPGVRPDLDTGSDDPRPSPAVRSLTVQRDEPAPRRLAPRYPTPEDSAPEVGASPRGPRGRIPQRDEGEAPTEARDVEPPGKPDRALTRTKNRGNEPPPEDATPALERPSTGAVEGDEPRTRPFEGVKDKPGRGPDGRDETDRGEGGGDEDRTEVEPEDPPRPPAGPTPSDEPDPTEDEPPTPDPEDTDPEGTDETDPEETTIPETTVPETTVPEADETSPETTVASETTGEG